MAAKKTGAVKKLGKKIAAKAKSLLKGKGKKAPPPAKRAAVKSVKRGNGRVAKTSAKKKGRAGAQKPRAARSSVKKGQTWIDNEDRAGGPRKLVIERIISEEAAPDRFGNPRADRRYAECEVIQNDEPQNRRVKVPLGKLCEPAYSLEGAPKAARVSDDEGDDEDAGADEEQ